MPGGGTTEIKCIEVGRLKSDKAGNPHAFELYSLQAFQPFLKPET
jgi:hypothetical protein